MYNNMLESPVALKKKKTPSQLYMIYSFETHLYFKETLVSSGEGLGLMI